MKYYIGVSMAFAVNAHVSKQFKGYWPKHCSHRKMAIRQPAYLWIYQRHSTPLITTYYYEKWKGTVFKDYHSNGLQVT